MAGIISPVDVNALFTSAQMKALLVYNQYTPDFADLAQAIPSTAQREAYVVTATAGALERLSEAKKHMGDQIAKTLYVENAEPWAKFMEVSEQQIQLQTAINWLDQQATALGTEAAGLVDDLVTAGLQAGSSTAWIDGVNFFSATHPINPWGAVVGNWSNLRTGFGLTPTNFETVWADISGRLGWNNRPLKIRGQMQLWLPTARVSAGKRIVEQAMSSDPGVTTAGGNNNINFGRAVIKHCPSLDDEPTVWYAALVGQSQKPVGLQEWRGLRFENEFDSAQSKGRFEDEKYRSKVSRGLEFVPLNAHLIIRCET